MNTTPKNLPNGKDNRFNNYRKKDGDWRKDFPPSTASLMEKTTFEEREDTVQGLLAQKFKVSLDKVSILIARESDTHMNGIFFIEGLTSENETGAFNGFFFATVSNNINIVWADKEMADCAVINTYSFPESMAPDCF